MSTYSFLKSVFNALIVGDLNDNRSLLARGFASEKQALSFGINKERIVKVKEQTDDTLDVSLKAFRLVLQQQGEIGIVVCSEIDFFSVKAEYQLHLTRFAVFLCEVLHRMNAFHTSIDQFNTSNNIHNYDVGNCGL